MLSRVEREVPGQNGARELRSGADVLPARQHGRLDQSDHLALIQSELKDEAAILALIMEGHDASIGICQVKFSTALMLDFGYPPKRFAGYTRTQRENAKAALARAAMPYAE